MGLFVMLVEKIEELEEKLKTHKFDCRFADLRKSLACGQIRRIRPKPFHRMDL
jgi:hypothetical protein